VDQPGPLHPATRTGEFEESTGHYHQNDVDRMKKAFGRLLGANWAHACKNGHDYTPPPKSERRWSYGEKSVVAVERPEAEASSTHCDKDA
jgi:hypothetical protein